MTLLSTIIQLTPAEPEQGDELTRVLSSGQSLGRATHAWFLDRVLAYDRTLAKRLHEPDLVRPFTVSNLWQGISEAQGVGEGPRLRTFNLRLTSIMPELTTLLTERMLPELPEGVTLAGRKLRVARVYDERESWEESPAAGRRIQPWVGSTTFETLVAQETLRERMPTRLKLRFASPTVFRSKKAYLPLPLPKLIFEGLVRKWNAFSPVQVHPDVNRYAEETMVISSYRLHTERVRFGEDGARGVIPGFVGQCSFAMRHHDRYWMGLIHLLAAFALYAGVGKNTAMGLGQTRLLAE